MDWIFHLKDMDWQRQINPSRRQDATDQRVKGISRLWDLPVLLSGMILGSCPGYLCPVSVLIGWYCCTECSCPVSVLMCSCTCIGYLCLKISLPNIHLKIANLKCSQWCGFSKNFMRLYKQCMYTVKKKLYQWTESKNVNYQKKL